MLPHGRIRPVSADEDVAVVGAAIGASDQDNFTVLRK